MERKLLAICSCVGLVLISGCYVMRPSAGGAQATSLTRHLDPQDIALPAGYKIELVARDLTFPTGVTFDPSGNACVVESGYSYGEVWTTPRLLKIEPDGKATQIAAGSRNGPWNGVTFHDGAFY